MPLSIVSSGFKMFLVGVSMYLGFATPFIAFFVVLYSIYKKAKSGEKVAFHDFPNLGVMGIQAAWLCTVPFLIAGGSIGGPGFGGLGVSFLIVMVGLASAAVAMTTAFIGYFFLRWKNGPVEKNEEMNRMDYSEIGGWRTSRMGMKLALIFLLVPFFILFLYFTGIIPYWLF